MNDGSTGMRFISQVASCLSRSSSDPWNRMPVTPLVVQLGRLSLHPLPPPSFLSFPITSEPVFSRLRRRLRRDVMGNDPRKLRQVVRILGLEVRLNDHEI